MRDTEVFSKLAGCGETDGDAAWRKTDGYLLVFFEKDTDSRIDHLVMFMYGQLIVGVD